MGEERATSFGEVAELYDAARPRYPEQLIQDVVGWPESKRLRILDVGCGTGIATAQFASLGCEIVGVEPDASMAAIADRRLQGEAEIVVGRFEELELGDSSFDRVVAAQAWHWVDPSLGYDLAHRLLKPDGVLGLFWNVRTRDDDPTTVAIEEHVRRAIPNEADDFMAPQGGRRSEAEIALHDSKMFSDPEVRRYQWKRTCSTKQYLELMMTHSVYRLLDDTQRDALLSGASHIIDASGGSFSFGYEAVLLLARRLQ